MKVHCCISEWHYMILLPLEQIFQSSHICVELNCVWNWIPHLLHPIKYNITLYVVRWQSAIYINLYCCHGGALLTAIASDGRNKISDMSRNIIASRHQATDHNALRNAARDFSQNFICELSFLPFLLFLFVR